MPLRRLTKVSKIELDKESAELKAAIKALIALLGSEEAIRTQVAVELDELAKRFATPRRTRCVA
jgi:DNA gyrase/topoisomerase IV subunit A